MPPSPRDGRPPLGSDAFPNANSPQLLTHVLEMLARGVRSTRGLQEALGIDQRTVQYYLHAGRWLGLLVDGAEPLLSPDGLSYVYAGPNRGEVYTRLVLQQPFVSSLLASTGTRLPHRNELAAAIGLAAPDLAEATVTRRASAVRGLIAPALEPRRLPEGRPVHQLALPLSQAPTVEPAPPLAQLAGKVFNPDIYRFVACYLIDHGELSLGHVRGLLDRAGAGDVALGPYVDLALERGDAVRIEERLVITAEAAKRRALLDNTASIILSDGGWREHLTRVQAAARRGEDLVKVQGRYRLWDRRLFGHALDSDHLKEDLARVLRDRNLSSWPRTHAEQATAPASKGVPYLDAWHTTGLAVCLPPSLAQLWEGLTGVNRRLRNARHRTDAVSLPTPAYRPVRVHGGLLHPDEPLPRSVPDERSLRLRLVANAPYVCMVVALLLRHRAEGTSAELRQWRGGWVVRRHRRTLGSVLDVLDGFVRDQGQIPARRPLGGLSDAVFMSLLERLGLMVCADELAMLDDGFFHLLRHDVDEGQLHDRLQPLADALSTYLDDLYARTEPGRTGARGAEGDRA